MKNGFFPFFVISMNKEIVIQQIQKLTKEKVEGLQKLIDEMRSSNNDTKSSMGDKYETGREMLQQEINQLQGQLNQALELQRIADKLSIQPSESIESSALANTNKGFFFFGISLGKMELDGKTLMCISMDAPLAKILAGKSIGNSITFNGMSFQLIDIF